MQAEPTAQKELLTIAHIDTQISQLVHRKRTLPEHEQLKKLNERRNSARDLVVAAQARLSDANRDMQRIESDLVPAKERLNRNRKRSTDGSVTDAKALRALLEEIDHLSGRIAKLEDEELELMQVIEDETKEEERLTQAKATVEESMRELLASRDAAGREIDAQLAELDKERTRLVKRLPESLMELYTKIAKRQGVGAAELRARRCVGCGLEIDATSLQRFASAAENVVLRCEECGRILIRTEASGLR